MPLLELANVLKSYKNHFWNKSIPAVTNLSFSVSSKSITGFIGPNGAGKTTSIKILLGLISPDRGTACIRGVPSGMPHARKNVAFVSEQPYFYNHLSVYESLSFVYNLNKLPASRQSSEIERVLQTVQLSTVAEKRIHILSKGMQQRLNMAHALLGDPDIFIFDEPMSGLDPLGRRLFRTIFRELHQQGKCVFFSTHIVEDIEAVCDTIIVLSKGSKVYAGGLNELLSQNRLGTELVVPAMPENHLQALRAKGYEVVIQDASHHIVFVPADRDIEACQTYLYENRLYPRSIVPRSRPLESILYDIGNEEETA